MMSSITKKYIIIGSKKIFVQVLGSGPTLALLHPSPHSSEMLLPLAQSLSEHYTVICIDTPGYGKSDKLDTTPDNISVYSDLLFELFKAMDITKISIYGSATGAQIGIRFALDYPELVSHLYLDNAAHFDDDLRNRILENYFPDLTPVKDGSHLKVLWDIVSNLFMYFPWCFKTPEFALNHPQLPANVLHAIALDFLKVGKDYDLAYKVAFMHEKAEHVQSLTVSTSIFRWEGSIILPYIDALVNHDFSENIEIVSLEKDPTVRSKAMVEHMVSKSSDQQHYSFPNNLKENYQETEMPPFSENPPDINESGDYLIQAWNTIAEKETNLSPQDIQQKLISWYNLSWV